MRRPKPLPLKAYFGILFAAISIVLTGVLTYYLDLPKDVPNKQILSRALFYTDVSDSNDGSLKLYDPQTGKSYNVWRNDDVSGHIAAEEEGSSLNYTYFNPMVLGNHSVAFYTQVEEWSNKDGKHNYNGYISIVNLKTGKQKTILKDIQGDMPPNLCCSVSPDGMTLAIPLKDGKLAFYNKGGKKIREMETGIRPLPEIEDRKRRDSHGLAMLSGGYPPLRWLDNNRLIAATGSSLRFDTTNAGHRDFNGLSVINIKTGNETFIKGTSGTSIPWFNIWQNQIVYASLDGPNDTDYQTPRLYKLALENNSKPQEINAAATYPHDNFVLDSADGILYTQTVQDNLAVVRSTEVSDKVVAINLKDNSRKAYSNVSFEIYEFANPDLLVSVMGGYDTRGSTYNLSTGQVKRIY